MDYGDTERIGFPQAAWDGVLEQIKYVQGFYKRGY